MMNPNKSPNQRIVREAKTIEVMIRLYCHDHHHKKELCDDCRSLLDYAMERLRKCPFAPDKPTCKNCTVHCYRPAEKKHIQQVMRYTGPRMLLHDPWLALRHLADGFFQ